MNRWIWVISAAMAYAVLLRPDGALLAVAVLAAMVWTLMRQGVGGLNGYGAVAACMAVALLPLVPWTLRNERTFHVFQPLAPRYTTDPGELESLGFHRWLRTWAIDYSSTVSVYWRYDGDSLEIEDLPQRAFDSAEQREKTAALFNDYNDLLEATPAIDARFGELADERVSANVLRYYLVLPVLRAGDMFLRPRTELFDFPAEWWKYREDWRTTAFALVYAGINLAYIVVAGLGAARASRGGDGRYLIGAIVVFIGLRFLLLGTIDNSEPRYSIVCFPLLIALAGGVFVERRSSRCG
jgi:hypothetical protein